MSIIQEALKRKEEMQSTPGVPPPVVRFAPPPAPSEEPPKRKKRVGVWLTVILVVVLLGVGAVGVVLLGAWFLLGKQMASVPAEEVDLVLQPSRPATPGDDEPGTGMFVPLVTPVERVVVRDPEPDVTTPSLTATPWPEVRVSAIMAPGGIIPGTVNINGTMLGAGDSIRGIRVVRIDQGEVLLEFEGARRLLRAGQTTGQ